MTETEQIETLRVQRDELDREVNALIDEVNRLQKENAGLKRDLENALNKIVEALNK